MNILFEKYHGTGNDFIIIDHRKRVFPFSGRESWKHIQAFCDRRFGIGADGLILIETSKNADFRMHYFNADGLPGSFCGNGSRCAVAFARKHNIIKNDTTRFEAADGLHKAWVKSQTGRMTFSGIGLNDVPSPEKMGERMYFVNSGSPHIVVFSEGIDHIDIYNEGKRLRHDTTHCRSGANVNFVELLESGNMYVRTYERGVENETLSCGSGVTAAAIASYHIGLAHHERLSIQTKGGMLSVRFSPPQNNGQPYRDVLLEGPAEFVFHGMTEINNKE